MKKLMLNVYEIGELKGKAKQRALDNMREAFGTDITSEYILECLKEELINCYGEGFKDVKILYSLSYSQGDGVAFDGNVDLTKVKGVPLTPDTYACISCYGRYTHYNSMAIAFDDDVTKEVEDKFKSIVKDASKMLTNYGYKVIEDYESDESMVQMAEANDIYFLESGKIAPKGEYIESSN